MAKQVNGFEVVEVAPKVTKWAPLRDALNKVPRGKWLAVPVDPAQNIAKVQATIAGTLRNRRTKWRIETRSDKPNNRIHVRRIA